MYNKVSRTSKQMFVKYQNGQYLHYYILPFGDKIGHYLNRYKREFNCNYRSFHSRDSLYLNSKYKIVIFFPFQTIEGFIFSPLKCFLSVILTILSGSLFLILLTWSHFKTLLPKRLARFLQEYVKKLARFSTYKNTYI